jgi:hypothetical protein
MKQEHKNKIGMANKIALKGKHCSPKTEFKKGCISSRKGKKYPSKQSAISRSTAKRIAEQNMDMNKCTICGDAEKRIEVHHINGNFKNNQLKNLGIVCSFCHFAIHDNGRNTRFQEVSL